MNIWIDEKFVRKDNPILTDIFNYVSSHIDTEGVETVVVSEFTNYKLIEFTVSLLLENGQLCYCKTPLEKDLSNWEEVVRNLCIGYSDIIEDVNRKESYNCVLDGRKIQFCKVYGTYTFSEEECKKLADGETIIFVTDTLPKEGMDQYKYVAVGKLEQADYEGDEVHGIGLVGFRRYGFVKDQKYQGLKPSWGGHTFTPEELKKLVDGESVVIEAVSSKTNKPYTAELTFSFEENKLVPTFL